MQKKILIAEDEKTLREPLVRLLTSEGFTVFEAEDGEQGLEIALKEHPDVVVTDVKMPKKEGLEMLADLRKDPWGKTVPVILLTNVNDVESVSAAMEHSVTDYFIKAESDLFEIVNKIKSKLPL